MSPSEDAVPSRHNHTPGSVKITMTLFTQDAPPPRTVHFSSSVIGILSEPSLFIQKASRNDATAYIQAAQSIHNLRDKMTGEFIWGRGRARADWCASRFCGHFLRAQLEAPQSPLCCRYEILENCLWALVLNYLGITGLHRILFDEYVYTVHSWSAESL